MSPDSKILKNIVKELQREMTWQQKKLWVDFLRDYPVRVVRQKIVDRFVVDFFCMRAKLVIEVGEGFSELREKVITGYGLSIMHVSDEEIEEDFEGVCERIDEAIRMRVPLK